MEIQGGSIITKSPDLWSIVVYSDYLKTNDKNCKISIRWNYKILDMIQSVDKEIAELTIKSQDGSKIIEQRMIKTPFIGKLLFINEDIENIETLSNKSSVLLMRVQICQHNILENPGNCSFCQEKPSKLDNFLEKIYFIDNRQQLSDLKLLKKKGVLNRIYSKGDELLLLESNKTLIKIISPIAGQLTWLSSEFLSSDKPIFSINPCKHPEIFQDLCTNCSEMVLDHQTSSSDHAHLLVKEVMIISEEGKRKYAEIEKQAFLSKEKLILILDLDNTLIHAIKSELNANNNSDIKLIDVYEWKINPYEKYLIKLRPYLLEFFRMVQPLYEIFLYTFGTRGYAEYIKCLLNDIKGGNMQSEKMIALEDNCQMPEKKIKRIVPYLDDMILILDDRIDVWPEDQKNLIFTKPYYYFREKNQEKLIVRPYDCYLFFAARTLMKVHRVFFKLKEFEKIPDVREILGFFKKNIFLGKKLCFSGIVEKNPENSTQSNRFVAICVDSGAMIIENIEKEKPDLLIVKEFRRSHKVNVAMKNKIPVVHFNWIDYSLMFCMMINWESFELNEEKFEIKDVWDMEKDLVENNKGFIEKYEDNIIKETVEFFRKK